VAKARIEVTGPVLRVRSWRTGKRGTVSLRIRPLARGKIRFRAVKRGYTPTQATLRVR